MKPKQEIKEKISILNKQIEIDPGNQKLYLERGILLLEDYKTDEAFEDFGKVIEIDPSTHKANIVHNFYKEIYRKQVEDLTEEMERDFASTLKLDLILESIYALILVMLMKICQLIPNSYIQLTSVS